MTITIMLTSFVLCDLLCNGLEKNLFNTWKKIDGDGDSIPVFSTCSFVSLLQKTRWTVGKINTFVRAATKVSAQQQKVI